MHRFLIVAGLLLSTTLIAPLAARADDRNHQDKRYYDRDARDYHQWNNNEDRAYRAYLQEQHQNYRAFHKKKHGQQQQYFKWRHGHPDNTLFKLEVR